MSRMPEYAAVTLLVLAVTGALAWWRGLLARRSTWLALGVFAVLTVVFDVVLTGLPIVTYGPEHLSGLMVGPMPIEDLGYGIALFLLAVLAWDAVAPRPRR